MADLAKCPSNHPRCDWSGWKTREASPLTEYRYCRRCGISEWRETPDDVRIPVSSVRRSCPRSTARGEGRPVETDAGGLVSGSPPAAAKSSKLTKRVGAEAEPDPEMNKNYMNEKQFTQEERSKRLQEWHLIKIVSGFSLGVIMGPIMGIMVLAIVGKTIDIFGIVLTFIFLMLAVIAPLGTFAFTRYLPILVDDNSNISVAHAIGIKLLGIMLILGNLFVMGVFLIAYGKFMYDSIEKIM